jgi:hypothetical protein
VDVARIFRTSSVVLSVALAYACQALLLGVPLIHVPVDARRGVGGVGLLAAALLFGLSVPEHGHPQSPARADFVPAAAAPLVAGILCCLTSIGTYAFAGENALVIGAWAGGAGCLLLAGRTRGRDRAGDAGGRWVAWALPLAIILGIALTMRLWRLTSLPPLLVGDAMNNGVWTRAFLQGPNRRILEFTPGLAPRTDVLPEALTMLVFGDDLFGLDMAAVVAGMLSIVGTFLLASELYDRRVGLLASALMAFSWTHLHFSRVQHGNDPEPWFVWSLYFLVRGLRTGASRDALAAGLLAGTCFQMYFSGRLVLVSWILLGAHAAARRRSSPRYWALAASGMLVAFGPMVILGAEHWPLLWQRAHDASIFEPRMMAHLESAWRVSGSSAVLVEATKRSFLTFVLYGNAWVERLPGLPFFDSVTAPLLVLGAGIAAVRPCRMADWLILTSFVAIVFLAVALTSDPPFWQRMVIVIPLAAILSALALDRLAQLLPLGRSASGLLLALIVGFIGWRNWTTFVANETIRDDALSAVARFAAALPPGRTLLVVEPPWNAERNHLRFMAPHLTRVTVTRTDAEADRWPPLASSPIVLLGPEAADLLPRIAVRWPGGVRRRLRLASGQAAGYAYEAPPGGQLVPRE